MTGIEHSVHFTEKLLQAMQERFGSIVLQLAEEITPQSIRLKWLEGVAEEPIQTYINNMRFLVTFLEKLKTLYGDEIALITSELVAKSEHARWCAVSKEAKEHTLEHFIELAWEPLRKHGFEFEVHKRENGLQIHCTRCPIHALSKMIGGSDWLAILECNKDLHNVTAFNSKITMTRTKTLLKGDSHCDHLYLS